MKKILLISNYVYHYRISNYNYFHDEFKKLGYEFHVLTNKAQEVSFEINFPLHTLDSNPLSYITFIKNLKPVVVITFLHLRDSIIYFVNTYCKLAKIPLIYWNFGINLKTPNAFLKNLIYYHIHNISDAILLYSPNEKKYIKEKHHHKVFVANNTLNFIDIHRNRYTNKQHLFEKYGVKEEHIILFSGKITPNKKIEALLECFRNNAMIAIVIVGGGLSKEHQKVVDETNNYYYLGPVYDKNEMANIFSNCDLFCIPGNLGLALNEAFFWGKPVVTTYFRKSNNTPEIWYFRENVNGFIAKDKKAFEDGVLDILNNREKYDRYSKAALKTADGIAHISQMFKGFKDAIVYVSNKKQSLLSG